MCNQEMMVGGIAVTIIRKHNLKNLYVRIHPPDGGVTVSAPSEVTDENITNFVLRKIPEITKVRDRMSSQPRQSKREYVSGESCYLWGKPYRLQVVYEGSQTNVRKAPNKIILTVSDGTTLQERERAITEWYRSELKRVLQPILIDCETRMGIASVECRVKNMKTKWGTCNVEAGRIWINLQLVKKPIECLEYVVTHELAHLLERNHTHRFQSLVSQYYPEWREAKKLLSEMPLDYFDKEETDTDDERQIESEHGF